MRSKEGHEGRGPQFLGIGAPRSGSTWLHLMLSQHPDVYLPPIKEVHYFDSIDPTLSEDFRINTSVGRWRRLFVSRVKHYVGAALAPLVVEFQSKAKPDLCWDFRFFWPGGDIGWYKRLFWHALPTHKMCGEITPAYIMLSDAVIKQIKEKVGVRKIIVVLRDPISATWSCVEKQYRDCSAAASDGYLKFGQAAVMERIRSPGLYARYNYSRNLENWCKFYDRDSILIAFYEELKESPELLLSKVFRFLEVEDISSKLMNVRDQASPVNAAHGMLGDIPPLVKRELAKLHASQIETLASTIGGRAVAWRTEVEQILRGLD